jgi:hypothetical protein
MKKDVEGVLPRLFALKTIEMWRGKPAATTSNLPTSLTRVLPDNPIFVQLILQGEHHYVK